jgi:PAT family beta-lactamase induction signal transducer AmpG
MSNTAEVPKLKLPYLFSMIFLGMASGTPLAVLSSTMLAFLKEGGTSLVFISSLLFWKFPYSIKFLWAPLLDRYHGPLGFVGRRKGWMLILIVFLSFLIGVWPQFLDLSGGNGWIYFVLATAFCGASFDVVVDAYRRDAFPLLQYGKATATFVIGYRIGALFAGGIAIGMAQYQSWPTVFMIIGATGMFGLVGTLLGPKECSEDPLAHPLTLTQSFLKPLHELFSIKGISLVITFLLLFKIGDSLIEALLTPFLLEVGYTKINIALVAKTYGLAAGLLGGVLGAVLLEKFSIKNSLLISGVLQLIANSGFIYLANSSPSIDALAVVNIAEKLAAGIGGTVLAAFLGSLCSIRFSATQFAILTSLLGIPRDVVSSTAGFFVEKLGWSTFFAFSMLAATPALFILLTKQFNALVEAQATKKSAF